MAVGVYDHNRAEWYGTDGPVTKSNGARRPRITPVNQVVIHYTGAGKSWLDAGDSAQEIRNIQSYASGAGKPWEYNVVIDSDGETWDYAGEFAAAHNGSGDANGDYGNYDALGFLVMYGLETLTHAQALMFVAGIRKALRQAVAAGHLDPVHTIRRHGDVRRGGSTCPGPIGDEPYWSAIVAPLTASDTAPPAAFRPELGVFGLWPLGVKPELANGHKSDAAAYFQGVMLTAEEFDITVDGWFGDESERVAREFQERHGLPVTGMVDADTWRAVDLRATGQPVGYPEQIVAGPSDGAWSLMKKFGIEPRSPEAIRWYERNYRVNPGDIVVWP